MVEESELDVDREMVKIALIKQILSVIVFISAVTIGCMIGMIFMGL